MHTTRFLSAPLTRSDLLPAPRDWMNIPRRDERRFSAVFRSQGPDSVIIHAAGPKAFSAAYDIEYRRRPETGKWYEVEGSSDAAYGSDADTEQRRDARKAARRLVGQSGRELE